METTRPEASEITGTLRAMSGFTVPVTTNSGAVACAVAVATGNCSGCWTEKTLTSNPGTILAEGGASALVSARAPPQPSRSSSDGTRAMRRPIFKTLLFIRDSFSVKRVDLELDHYAGAEGNLGVAKIREPDTARSTTIRVRRPEVVCPGRGAVGAAVLRGGAIISARRRNAPSPWPIGTIGVAIPGFRPPGDVLFGHPVKRGGSIVHVGLVPGVFSEVGRAGDGIGPIDRRQQRQIAARVGHLAAAERDGKLVLVKPDPVVDHPTQEGLLRPTLATVASYPSTVFTARVGREGEGHLADALILFRLVVISHLDAVIGVDTGAAGIAQRIRAITVIVENQRKPLVRAV